MTRRLLLFLVLLSGLILLAGGVLASGLAAQDTGMTEEELLARGEYLIHIGGCIDCHTPGKAEYNAPPEQWTPEQVRTLALFGFDTLDLDRLLSGGRFFPLPPAGAVITRNLTPHRATGLGLWTDEQIEAAIRIGVSRDGTRLFPLMPYRNFYNLSRQDMAAIIAYLRSIPPVRNRVERIAPPFEAPELTPREDLPDTAPDGSDPVELGRYLVTTVMGCGDCHTPLDPETGAPIEEMALAGGQPFEGPWGIVYGGNITPDEKTGIGGWTAEDIVRVLREGVRPDGRRLVIMPWQVYSFATDEDIAAVAAYLLSNEPIENEIPAPAINEMLLEFVEG